MRGNFDTILIRPLSTFFQVFAQDFLLRRVGRFAQAFAVLLISNSQLTITWSLTKVGYLLVSLLSGTCFFIGLFVIGATSCFWTIQSIEIINIFTYGGTFMGSYPFSINLSVVVSAFFHFYYSTGVCQLFSVSFSIGKSRIFWSLATWRAISPLCGIPFSGCHHAILAVGCVALSEYGPLMRSTSGKCKSDLADLRVSLVSNVFHKVLGFTTFFGWHRFSVGIGGVCVFKQ